MQSSLKLAAEIYLLLTFTLQRFITMLATVDCHTWARRKLLVNGVFTRSSKRSTIFQQMHSKYTC